MKKMGIFVLAAALMGAVTVCSSGCTSFASQNNNNFLIDIEKDSVGKITKETSHSSLEKAYGKKNVKLTQVSGAEGETSLGTEIYLNEKNKRASVIWGDTSKKQRPVSITIRGSIWELSNGIKIGSTLKELEKINGGPFSLMGFGWDYGGTIIDWKGGKLEKLKKSPGNAIVLILDLPESYDNDEGFRKADPVMGDSTFDSSNTLLQEINPVVSQIAVIWNKDNESE